MQQKFALEKVVKFALEKVSKTRKSSLPLIISLFTVSSVRPRNCSWRVATQTALARLVIKWYAFHVSPSIFDVQSFSDISSVHSNTMRPSVLDWQFNSMTANLPSCSAFMSWHELRSFKMTRWWHISSSDNLVSINRVASCRNFSSFAAISYGTFGRCSIAELPTSNNKIH